MTTLLLASQSPARLATLRAAGITPVVRVSGVDEDAVLVHARHLAGGTLEPQDAVLALAQAKAFAVAGSIGASDDDGAAGSADLLVACDSMLEIDGEVVGKPRTPGVAVERWRSMRGRTATLHTGHWLIDLRDAEDGGTGGTLGATASTVVELADLGDAEIDAYVATGEPLAVAGGFTVDGLGGAYVTAIEGDFHNVVGISLPLLRELVGSVGVAWHELWDAAGAR